MKLYFEVFFSNRPVLLLHLLLSLLIIMMIKNNEVSHVGCILYKVYLFPSVTENPFSGGITLGTALRQRRCENNGTHRR